jgi:ankyrin repeat protein
LITWRPLLRFSLAALFLLACNVRPYAHFTPLADAARAGDIAAIHQLISHGADPNEVAGQNNWTPLLHAIHKGEIGSVTALLDGGADINRISGDGVTPLMMAAGYGYTNIVELLLRRGADPAIAGSHGATALDLALTGVSDIDRFTLFDCQNETVKVLQRAGAPSTTVPAARTWARLKRC